MQYRRLSSLAKYRVVLVIGKGGSWAAALQIASSQYSARVSSIGESFLPGLRETNKECCTK
jgi:hypothetical protein